MEIETIYQRHCATKTAISAHLPTLRNLAAGLSLAMEFGVKRGASSSALLMGAERVISYDIAPTPEAKELQRIAGGQWDYRIGDSRKAPPEACDLLFVDSQHDYPTCKAELDRHADSVRRFLVLHDVTTFGEVGALGESGKQAWQYVVGQTCPPEALGIRPAIDELQIRDPSWRIAARFTESHGLLVLQRR
jgi:hypothetical protein